MTGAIGMMFGNQTPTVVVGGGGAGQPNFADVNLLLHMDGSDNGTTFTDSSNTASVWTASGGSRTDTGTKKFGSAAYEMQGISSDSPQSRGIISAEAATYTALRMSNNFTFEFWYYTSNSGSVKGISGYGFYSFLCYVNGQTLTFELSSVTAGISSVEKTYTAGTVPLNQWNHIAVTREGANFQVWLNGTRTVNATDMFTNAIRTQRAADGVDATKFAFGSTNHTGISTQHLGGWLDDVRIANAIVYSGATITVPTAAHPDS